MDRQKLGDKMYMGKHLKGSTARLPQKKSQFVAPLKHNFGEEPLSNHFPPALDDCSFRSRPKGVGHFHGDALPRSGSEGAGFLRRENRVSYNLDFKSKKEKSDLKAKLHNELMSVRHLMKRIDRYDGMKAGVDGGANVGRLKRVHSVVDSVGGPESRPLEQLSMPEGKYRGTATSKFGQGVGKKNLDVTLSEEKVPLSVQAKKPKANEKKNGGEFGSMSGMENTSSKVFRSCSLLLNKLMKSKVGWVFNKPVDVKALGLLDYFTIIKHPMDLGTIKTRLSTKSYRTPKEFAGDVRLTFHNAMTYNMEGHEVHTFAKQLLKMFEDNWASIEADFSRQSFTAANSEVDLPAPVPTSLRTRSPLTAPSQPPPLTAPLLSPLPDMDMKVDRSEVLTAVLEAKSSSVSTFAKARLPKPKAKDLHKREMTIEEKQKLSSDLQNLPSEKLEGVLRVIKKRNPALCQHDDEIEVDIDTVDTETLWELDRFVINYKKALSKTRRSAGLAPIGAVIEPNLHEENQADSGIEEAKENEADEKNYHSSSSNEREKEGGDNASVSNGSSSSSSESGSSSSDSDSDSSSS